jgi:selenocysteine-specific elongation factor
MKNVIMGTAGHIDHGKTTLVERLTGINTDRLQEEKRRGMTIELGFAPLTLPSGNIVSVIDVPGHEKFVKTMVAGVTGIDFVMLVIAADEGVMPQTKEHVDILSLLDIKSGVIALTKSDLVEDEWLQMVEGDVRESLKGTNLENFPIVPVSSVTGKGLDELISYLEKLAGEASKAKAKELFRLSVDRVFTITGHGTVITGTISGGEVKKGDMVEVLPQGLAARVRGVQVHSKDVDIATAGDRCALNIAGIEKSDIERGNVVAKEGMINSTRIVDAVLYAIKDIKSIAHNQRVHVHIGTKEVLARVRVLGANEILGGSKGYVQLRFEEPVVALRRDKFIVRAYSPVVTLGGGEIIFHSAANRKRFSEGTIKALTIGEIGTVEEVMDLIMKDSGRLLSVDDLFKETLVNEKEIEETLLRLTELEEIVHLKETKNYLSKTLYEQYIKEINTEFHNLYKRNPFKTGIDKEEIKSKIFKASDMKEFSELLNIYIKNNIFKLENNFIVEADSGIVNKVYEMKEVKLVEETLHSYSLDIKNANQLKETISIGKYNVEDIISFLIRHHKIIDLGGGLLIHKDILQDTVQRLRSIFNNKDEITVVYFRDHLKISRKTAVAVLEYLDGLGVTTRQDDVRKPGIHYMNYFI